MEAQLTKLKYERAGHKATITKRQSEIVELIDSGCDVDLVNKKCEELTASWRRLSGKHGEYVSLLQSDSDEITAADIYIEEVEDGMKNILSEVKIYTTRMARRAAENQTADTDENDVAPGDSDSQTGANQLVKARARKAILLARAETMRKKQELESQQRHLELEQLRLKHISDSLTLEGEIREAELEDKIYSEGVTGDISFAQSKLNATQGLRWPQVDPHTYPKHPHTTEVPQTTRDPQQETVSSSLLELQRKMFDVMQLPKPSVQTFNGDPLQYWTFMRSFEGSVECTDVSNSVKLNHLLHCCTGRALSVIQCCAVMDPEDGYAEAKNLLRTRFGNPYVIAKAWVEKVTEGSQIRPSDTLSLQTFADDLKGCVLTLKAMGRLAEIDNQIRMVKMVNKLPLFLQNRWRTYAVRTLNEKHNYPDIDCFVKFVVAASDEMNDPVFGGAMTRAPSDRGATRSQSANFSVQAGQGGQYESQQFTGISCHRCSGDHPLVRCSIFRELQPQERLDFVRSKHLCFNCFSPRHAVKDCPKSRRCSVSGCKSKHSRFLHVLSGSETQAKGSGGQNNHIFVRSSSYVSSSALPGVALPVVPVRVKVIGDNGYVDTYALLDSGSTNTFCSRGLLNMLEVQGEPGKLSLTTLDRTKGDTDVLSVSLEVSDIEMTQVVALPHVFSTTEFPDLKGTSVGRGDMDRWPHLKGLDFSKVKGGKVTLLIGQDVPLALRPTEVRCGKSNEPYACRTVFGWTLNGPLGGTCQKSAQSNFIRCQASDDRFLSEQVERFWSLEQVEDKEGMSVNDKRVIELWDQTTVLENGHYHMKIPFRNSSPNLPVNMSVAESRLESLGRKLMRNKDLHERYKSEVVGLLDKGYAEKVPIDEIDRKDGKVWYLPHHGVIQANKPEKLRVVYDCSAVYGGTSLNREILQGPDLTNGLLGVLQRFRQEQVALVGDVEAMFHQVFVPKGDRDVLRFLWWKNSDPTLPPEIYRMRVHLFGGIWSPSCASYALRKTAEENQAAYNKEVVETVRRNFYVDDCLKAMPTVTQGIELVKGLGDMLQHGGFAMKKWMSNSRQVINSVPFGDRAKSVKALDVNQDSLPVERVLGVVWNPESDEMGIAVNPKDRPTTRRGVLSVTSSLYDPLGIVCPFVLLAKIILQDETQRKKDWDASLKPINLQKWQQWNADLQHLKNLRMSRCFVPSSFGQIAVCQLHHFADASQVAYGVVSYIRIIDIDGRVHCRFLQAKSRLAPVKTQTIPRLELSAAVLAARMDQVSRKELELEIHDSFFWTDSMIVLGYVKNETKRFHTFVSNRVSAIHERSSATQWRYVSTVENPADDVSRGLDADALLTNSRWFSGPDFLWEAESAWPRTVPEYPVSDDNKEVKRESTTCTVVTEAMDDPISRLFERYSCWYRLKKAVAWFLRLKSLLRNKQRNQPISGELTVYEIKAAEIEIVRAVQRRHFPLEIRDLDSHWSSVKRSSRIFKLEPTMNSSGVLCIGGRLRHAHIQEDSKHQMILPKQDHVTTLIVRHCHQSTGHSGRECVLAETRCKYWIVSARSVINRVIRCCVQCKHREGHPGCQRMADLPADRVTAGKPPFSVVGVDCFGPCLVKRGRSEIKRYGCLFTCASVRAIHIEKLDSMDTNSFLNAFRRFESRRGHPEIVRSDNGSNFIGGEREIREAIRAWNQEAITEHMRQKEIQWLFNPPSASHMGGFWERQIRSVRRILTSLLGNVRLLDDECLSTLFCEVEAMVNNRPITSVSSDPRDAEPLTPNHLLILRRGVPFSVGNICKADSYKRRWKHVQSLADQFWYRWVREYLPTVQLRQKWSDETRNLSVDDVVLIRGEAMCRGHWPLGRVTKVFSGEDGLVRSVEVRTQNTTLVRPIHKLSLLEGVY